MKRISRTTRFAFKHSTLFTQMDVEHLTKIEIGGNRELREWMRNEYEDMNSLNRKYDKLYTTEIRQFEQLESQGRIAFILKNSLQ